MILPPYTNIEEFKEHHGDIGVKKYIDMSTYGRELQK